MDEDRGTGATYARRGAVGVVVLARPGSRNALDRTTREALRASLQRAAEDEDARAVVLTGDGGSFCSGQDLREHAAALEAAGGAAERGRAVRTTVLEGYAPVVRLLLTMAKPVVAAVEGPAAGAGAAFALACDLRVMSRSARLLPAFVGIGLPCDSGISWTLPRLVGGARAADLLLRPRAVTAEQAAAWGLVSEVAADGQALAVALRVAEELAAGPTVALAAVKEALRHAATSDLDAALGREADLMARAASTGDHGDAVEAFLARRAPTFRGR